MTVRLSPITQKELYPGKGFTKGPCLDSLGKCTQTPQWNFSETRIDTHYLVLSFGGGQSISANILESSLSHKKNLIVIHDNVFLGFNYILSMI